MIDFLSHVRSDADRIVAMAELGMDAPVPSCPGWKVRDLVAHTGVVYAHKTAIVRDGWVDEQPDPVVAPQANLLEWFRNQADEMLAVLTKADPSTPAATWSPDDHTVGFWWRRMAHESVIHRLDAELAHDQVTAVDAALGADGVDEILSLMMTGAPDWSETVMGDSVITITETDGGRTWRLRAGTFSGTSPGGNVYAGEPTFFFDPINGDAHAEAAASISGPAGDLDSWLWGRGPLDRLTIDGDSTLVALVRSVAADSTG